MCFGQTPPRPAEMMPFGIDRVLQGLAEPPQRVVVERVVAHDQVLEDRRRAVFAPAALRAQVRQVRERFPLALILLHIDPRYRESHDEYECPVHPGRRCGSRVGERPHPHFPEGFGEDFLGFQDGFAGFGDERREPHLAIPAQRVGVRPGPHPEDFHVWNAERHLVQSLDFVGRDRPLKFVIEAEFGARDIAEQPLGVIPVGPYGFPGPVELEFAAVVGRVVALCPAFEVLRGTGEWLIQNLRDLRLGEMRRQRRVVARHADQAGVFELVHDRDEIDDVAPRRNGHGALQIGFRLREQVKPHLRDHAEVALGEQAVDVRAETVAVFAPGVGAGQGAHAGAHQLAVRQDHFHAAVRNEMVAIGAPRIADAMIERVADHAAPARVRAVDEHLQVAVLDVAVQVEVGHARLDDGVVALVVDLDDAVHALEIEHDAAGEVGCGTAVAEVAAGRDRIDRDAIAVRRAHDRLDFIHVVRRDRGGDQDLLGLVLHRRVGVAVQARILVLGEYPVASHGVLEFAESRLEVLFVNARGYRHHNSPVFCVR